MMKYVIAKNKAGLIQCSVFSDNLSHLAVAEAFKSEGYKAVAAGFCYFEHGSLRSALGRVSVSTGLEPTCSDDFFLDKMIKGYPLSTYLDMDNEFYNSIE